jgi:hypothetical protein
MRTPVAAALLALALLLGSTPAGSPQIAAPLFSGRYRLTLTFGPGCQVQMRSVSIALELSEAAVTSGLEVDGRSLNSEEYEWTRMVLHHVRSSIHGPFATWGGRDDRRPVTSMEGLYVLPWLMLDGTVTTTSGRPQAHGTALGVLQVGHPEDDYPNTLGYCSAADHTWSLDPQ